MNNLYKLGWNSHLNEVFQQSHFNTLTPGRVIIAHKTCYEVSTGSNSFLCELTGRLLFSLQEEELPCTGDWVFFQITDEQRGIIIDLFPREKSLSRKRAGKTSAKQIIASYVDKACIIETLDLNLNIRKIERFIAQISGEGIDPVIILTKADLVSDHVTLLSGLKHLDAAIPIFITSSFSSEGLQPLKEYIKEGETFVFIGSSGVGKSSLINALLSNDRLATSTISDSTGKGKHTSVRRELVILDNGGIIIDTPGVREFGVTFDSSEMNNSMLFIEDLDEKCRFTNCSHTTEPGCAVLKAVEEGKLDYDVYQSYLKLKLEAAHFIESEHERREKGKKLSRLISNYKDFRRKNE